MKKNKTILLFVLLFLSCYYACYFILFNVVIENKPLIQRVQEKTVLTKDIFGKSLNEFNRDTLYDIIFLGSSHVYRCFDPAIFKKHGIAAYNLGSSSQTPLNSFSILKSVIKNTRSVIMEVYPVASGLSGEESFLSMNASINNYGILTEMAFNLNTLRCYNLLSIKPFIDVYNENKPYNIPITNNGYVETPDSAGAINEYEHITLNDACISKQLLYIKKIIEYCSEAKVSLALVYSPVPCELKITGETAFINSIKNMAKKNKIPFYNFGRDHNLNSKTHFFDDDHLNKAGVALFNNKLIEAMANRWPSQQ